MTARSGRPRPPAVSVIVPVWNVEDHVADCLASLAAQSLADFEAIVVDDGSTDASFARARAAVAGDARFRFLQQENRGLSAARNAGLAAARGPLIAFLDSDDRVASDWLAALHRALRITGADWVACAVRFVNLAGVDRVHPAIHGPPPPGVRSGIGAPVRFALHDWRDVIRHYPSAWNKLYRRSLIGDVRFDEGMLYEDHAFFWQLAARTDHLLWLPQPLYLQTQGRAGQITRDGGERVFQQIAVLDRLAGIAAAADRPGAASALARIATRLGWERAQSLQDPDRRARFAAACRDWFDRHGLTPDAGWDPTIGRAWLERLAGRVPLTVVVTGADAPGLAATLDSLADQSLRDREIVVVPVGAAATAPAAAAADRGTTVLPAENPLEATASGTADAEGAGAEGAGALAAARDRGLAAARGGLVMLLAAGDRLLHPDALAGRVEAMLRSGAALGVAGVRLADDADGAPGPMLPRFHDGRSERPGPIAFDGAAALALRAEPSGLILRRGLLGDPGFAALPGPLSAWAPVLAAALRAQDAGLLIDAVDIALAPRPAPAAPLPGLGVDRLAEALPAPLRSALPPGWQAALAARAEAVRQGAGDDCTARPESPITPPGTGRTDTETEMLSFCTRDGAALSYAVDFRQHPYANISFFDVARSDILFHLSLRHADWLAVSNRRIAGRWDEERQLPLMLEEAGDRIEIRFPAADRVEILVNGEELCTHEGVFDRLDEIVAADFHGGVVLDSLEASGPHNAGRGGLGVLDLRPGLRVEGWAFDPQGGPTQRLALGVGNGAETLPLAGHPRSEIGARFGQPAARLGLAMVLPGRLWQAVPGATDSVGGDPALRLQAMSNGIPCGAPLMLRRSAILAQIEALAADPAAVQDATAVLTAVEHVRFAGLWPVLSLPAQAALSRAAQAFGVGDYLLAAPATGAGGARPAAAAFAPQPPAPQVAAPQPSSAQPSGPPPATPDRVADVLTGVRRSFAETLRGVPGTDPAALLTDMLRRPLPVAVRRELCLGLTETFCARDAFPALFGLVMQDHQLAGSFTDPAEAGDAWMASVRLPFLYLRGDAAVATELLRALSKPLPGWLCTATPAWVMRDLTGPHPVPMTGPQRAEMIRAFLSLLEREAEAYDGRAGCVELIRGMVALLCAAERLEAELRRAVEATALRVHGLSRAFWERVDAAAGAGTLTLTPRLQAGRSAFAAVAVCATAGTAPTEADQVAAEAGLRLLAGAGCAAEPRVRRDLFGPAGLSPAAAVPMAGTDAASSPMALLAAGCDPDEALLRHFAAPGAGLVPAALTPLTRQAVAARDGVAPLPMADVLSRASRRAAALLAARAGRGAEGGVTDGATDGAELAALLEDIAATCDGPCGFAGLGLGLRLLHALLRLRALAEAGQVLGALDAACRRLSAEEVARLPAAAAVRSGLWGLRRFEAALQRDAADRDEADGLKADGDAAELAGLALALFAEALPGVEALPLPAETGMADAATALADDPRAALFDMLVVVLSCRPYLDTRLPVLRAGWLARLEALGVPWIVAVGGTDGVARLEDRVLHLDAPDDYEGLPLKSLAMLEWVHDHTGFAHVLKVDDDCLIDAEALLHSQGHTTASYYGRRIARGPGQMDRTWHVSKSATDRGRLELDKSPDASVYCDGGSGYALDRHALAALAAAVASPEGQTLISVSRMEDKLVGDLLASRGVTPDGTGYRVAVHRRPGPGALPVPRWSHSFLPGPASGVQIAHLDSTEAQAQALRALDAPLLLPSKIWPTFLPARLGETCNALTLLSPPERLARAAAAPVAVVACVRNEAAMLPLFLEHYRRMGVEGFLIVDNLSDDGSPEFLHDQPDVAVFSADTDYDRSLYGVAWQQALLAHYRADRWTLVADADEFLVCDLDRRSRLPDLLAEPGFAEAEAVRLFLLDMYPAGSLAAADFAGGDPFALADHVDRVPFLTASLGRGPHSDAPTWTSALRHRLFPGSRPELFVAQKIALLRYRPWMRLSAGLHYVADARLAERAFVLAHFKYHAGFHARARAEAARGRHFNTAEEYRKYLALVDSGREGLFDPEVSVPWRDCAFVRNLLAAQPPRRRARRKAG